MRQDVEESPRNVRNLASDLCVLVNPRPLWPDNCAHGMKLWQFLHKKAKKVDVPSQK